MTKANRAISMLVVGLLPAAMAAAQAAPSQIATPQTLTLKDALQLARVNSVEYHAALTEAGLAREDVVIARSALLPSLNQQTQYLYTQPLRGAGPESPRFIANNSVHEYISQAVAHEEISLGAISDLSRSQALAAAARARAEIATRGLLVTVVQHFYALAAAQRKLATAQRALDEANRFLNLSVQLEKGGEVAHSDVIKAQLQANDRARDFKEAQLAASRARLELAVLIFKDFNQGFSIAEDLDAPEPLATREEIAKLAQNRNPEVGAAFAASRAAQFEVKAARAAYLPTLSFDYNYGIDATHFATKTDGVRNLGYSASASLNLPIWNWGATHSKVKQAILQSQQSRLELSAAQRRLLADLEGKYAEAASALQQLDLLRDSATLAAESLRLTTLRYQGGEATVLEVVDAQNTLSQARNALDDGEVRYKVALADLQTLTGSNP